MIINLVISSVSIGLFFNFDFKLIPTFHRDNLKAVFEPRDARADTASTTVEVRNAAPHFTAGPAENPSSTSTTPVNYGSALPFTATAQDDEGNNYYLIVCTTNSVTASTTGGVPTCGGVQLCVSGAVASGNPNTCTYSPVNIAGETQAWYAFVCDTHASQGECSAAEQGTGDSGSPFYINHAPTLTAVSATTDFLAPGGTFTFTATSTDADNARGGDELKLFICDNAGWATTTGCTGVTYCSSTLVQAVGNQAVNSCNYTDIEPTQDNAYTVYAYIYDEFYLAGVNNGTTTTFTIINVAPVVQGAYLVPNDVNEIQLNIKDAAAVVVYATSTNVSDQNGCNDLVSATSTIYYSAVSGGYNCASNANNCYPIASTNCTISDCVGAVAAVTCTTTIAYHAIPTDASSYYAADTWLAAIAVRDEALFGVGTSSPGTDIKTSEALDVDENLIDYGQLTSGGNTGTNSATTTVVNFGNCPIDTVPALQMSGIYNGVNTFTVAIDPDGTW